MFYNKALLGPESNFSTYPIQKLVELKKTHIQINMKNHLDLKQHQLLDH